MSTFTKELWSSISPIFQVILEHPFIRGLTDGSLPEPQFRFYVIQDALYLQDYARTLAIAAAKAPRDQWCLVFAGHVRDALVAERALHEGFFQHWRMSPEEVYATPKAPTNLAYTSYLLRVAYEAPFHEVVGALIPCYWIYWEVGKALEARGSSHPLYQRWINMYASEEYASVVQQVLEIVDELAVDLTPAQRAAALRHALVSSRYEWMFWDAAWRLEGWPV